MLSVLLVAGAALFATAVATERRGDDHHDEAGVEETHEEGEQGGEKVLGLNLESTPLVVAAVVASPVLAAATWRSANRSWLLAALLFAAAFAVLDVAEVVHLLDASRTGLAVLATVVAAVHAAAAIVAWQRQRLPA